MIESIDRRRARRQSGFTLIELLVVITILGVLSAVVVFAVGGIRDRGASAANKIDERTLRTAQEAYFAKNQQYATMDELVTGGFLRQAATLHGVVPSADRTSYSIGTEGGTLVVGETFAIPTFNPAGNTNGSTHAYWEIMFNGLLSLDGAGNPQPELATEVPTVANGGITDNGATYTLHLRNDVFWHDSGVVTPTNPTGAVQQFTADDVKFTFEKILLRFHARTRNMTLALASWDSVNFVASIDVIDPFTVRFRFTNPYAPLLKQLNVTEAAMNPKHAYTATNPTQANVDANTVGTGPFMCEVPNTTPAACRNGNGSADALVVKNPGYFRVGLPFMDRIVMRVLTDDTARKNALLNGEVDWIWDTPDPFVAAVNADPNLRTASTQSLGGGPNSIDQFIFNLWRSGDSVASIVANTATPHPILGGAVNSSGWKVRKAISEAINRANYLASGRTGIGTVATAPISSELPQHATDVALPAFNVADANALLDSAGWNGPPSGGFRTWAGAQTPAGCGASVVGQCLNPGDPFVLRMLTGSLIFNARAALLDSDLAAVGIDLEVTLNTTNANTVVFSNRNFDTYILNLAQGYDPHIGVRRQYHSDQISTTGTPNNAPGYKNAVVDAAFDDGVKTIDPAVRLQKYHDFQAQVAIDLPYVWLIETPNVRGFKATCTGFKEYTGLFAETGSCSP